MTSPADKKSLRHLSAPRRIFFHMPKTAGQTFINLVSREYAGRVIDTKCGVLIPESWHWFTGVLAEKPADEREQNRALTGRMKFGAHELFPGPSEYVTFMRDPVKRFVSFYRMVKRLGMVATDHSFDLDQPDWNRPKDDWFTRELDNGQTRALANANWDLPFGQVTEEHFDAAMANLEKHFIFVGVTERFDLSLMMLSRVCNWRFHLYVPKNVAPRTETESPVSPKVRAAIAELNSFDRRLYHHAYMQFEKRVQAGGLPLRLRYQLFRASNVVHGRVHRVLGWRRKRRKLREASEPLLEPGEGARVDL